MFAFTGVLLRGNKQIRDEYISFHFSTKEKINRCGTVKNGSKSYYPHYEITFFFFLSVNLPFILLYFNVEVEDN